MGCCLSAFAKNISNGYYEATLEQRRDSKRIYFSHFNNGSSSAVYSAHTSPLRRNVLSRCTSTPSNKKRIAPKGKTYNLTLTYKDVPTALEMLSICDDFGEVAKMQRHQENKSFGYYSESMSTESSVSTPSNSSLRHTQDTSLCPKVTTQIPNKLKMEMYMMSLSQGLMPKTSSPIFQRRDLPTFDAVAVASPSSLSYRKWANYLQSTPTYILHNVTDIPEAIAGLFSPINFPAFTDLEEMESAAKRFKVDNIHLATKSGEDVVFYQKQTPNPPNVTHIITTNL